MVETNQMIVLARRPSGQASVEDFRLVEAPVPDLQEGEILVRVEYFSLDPFMRGRMEDRRSYAEPQKLGEVMIAAGVGRVVASRHPGLVVDDEVIGTFGWQRYALSDGRGVRKLDTARVPITAYLGPVGVPGLTAYYGIHRICQPKPGETVVVSAAAGAVGSVAGQLAKQAGCRVVGIAGGPLKCRHVVEELGFDACLDHRSATLHAELKAAAPGGVDAVFENVGGEVFDTVLRRMNAFGRIALCGLVAGYQGAPIPIHNTLSFLTNRLTMRAFIITEQREIWPEALAALAAGVASGAIKYRETIAEGLERAPEAFLGLLAGKNLGKQLVKLA
jgi:NADPH-dependent curcumin reductase CurA